MKVLIGKGDGCLGLAVPIAPVENKDSIFFRGASSGENLFFQFFEKVIASNKMGMGGRKRKDSSEIHHQASEVVEFMRNLHSFPMTLDKIPGNSFSQRKKPF